jgi:hypothetical protein
VVLVASDTSGHAIIIEGEVQCRLVPLPGATVKRIKELSCQLQKLSKHARSARGIRKVGAAEAGLIDVYSDLWRLAMLPIVEALHWPVCLPLYLPTAPVETSQRSEGRQRRRLVLCPTGIFMQLPLHAAGIYNGDQQVSCSDFFVSSYTPSIAALLQAQQSAKPVRRSEADTLLVAVNCPFQGSALPMASKEADVVQRMISPSARVVRASVYDQVLEHIESAAILHLACHGTQNIGDALQSSFHLDDGLLPVSKLMELELPSAFLAVLSACETAKGDIAQPDQAIRLAATMLFAGFKSVVATMWYVRSSVECETAVTHRHRRGQVHGRHRRPRYRTGHLLGALQEGREIRVSRPRRRALRTGRRAAEAAEVRSRS